MSDRLLDRPLIHMPSFAPGDWINSSRPLTRESLFGRVTLVDFWDYTCVNCLRTLPYLKSWHSRYHEKGLTIIGVHAPEFSFGRAVGEVRAAVSRLELPYPVLLDNEHGTWERFANKAWPTKHLIDADGYIRMRRQGEGHYREVEQGIQILLHRRDPSVSLPSLLPPLQPEDAPGAVCYRPTPEIYAGYRGGGLFGGGLGNPEGYVTGSPVHYVLPAPGEREMGRFYLEGFWRAQPEAVVFAGRERGRVLLRYRAAGINAVLSPSADPVDVMLGLRPSTAEPLIEVRLDGRPLTELTAGKDVEITPGGQSIVRVHRPRLYQLVKTADFTSARLDLIFRAAGLALYTFTFDGCLAPPEAGDQPATYRVA